MYKCKNNDDCANDNLCCFSCDKFKECKTKHWLCCQVLKIEKPEDCPFISEED